MIDYFTFHSRQLLYQQTYNESNLVINTRTKWKSRQTKCLIRFCDMKSTTENNDIYIQVFSKAQKLSASPNNYSRLKVPVNSPAIWNVSIALWSGCKNNHHLHLVSFKPLTPFQSMKTSPGLWVRTPYIIVSTFYYFNESVSVLS